MFNKTGAAYKQSILEFLLPIRDFLSNDSTVRSSVYTFPMFRLEKCLSGRVFSALCFSPFAGGSKSGFDTRAALVVVGINVKHEIGLRGSVVSAVVLNPSAEGKRAGSIPAQPWMLYVSHLCC